MPWVDIIFFALLVIFAIVGCVKGFLKSLLGLFSTFITLLLAIWLAKPVSGLVDSLFGLSATFGSLMQGSIHDAFAGGIPVVFQGLVTILMGSEYMEGADTTSLEFAADFSFKLGEIITVVICVIILYFIIRFVLYLLGRLFDVITKSRAISGLDRVLGFVLGAAKGVLCLFVIFGVAYLISMFIPGLNDTILNVIEPNGVSSPFYNWVRDVIENTIIPFFFG
ncbi:MAG: CvpA family protein [Clostridia bacterium]|nr:CvpA family protein [Clostridia bacterium]